MLEAAESRGAAAVVITLDTPGGLGSTMRNLAGHLLEAATPTVVYVSPRGAQAASAGTLVTVAANIAAMAPGTNIGAASPVSGTGEDLPPTLRRKVDEDITALVRSIAALRGRNAEAIEATVLEARAYSAEEALALNVIDRIAPDLETLLAEIDGEQVGDGGRPAAACNGGRGSGHDRTLDRRALSGNPDQPNIGLRAGAAGNLRRALRDSRSGQLRPGRDRRAGAGARLSRHRLLPLNLSGVLLLVAGCLLLLLESQLDGFGWAGIGAVICWLFAGFLLVGELFPEPTALDDPLEISRWVIGLFAGVTLGFIALLWVLGRGGGKSEAFMAESERRVLDREGAALETLRPSGAVEIDGERWIGMTEGEDISVGAAVRVVGIYAGGVVKVVRADDDAAILAMRTAPGRVAGWRGRAAELSLARVWARLRAGTE